MGIWKVFKRLDPRFRGDDVVSGYGGDISDEWGGDVASGCKDDSTDGRQNNTQGLLHLIVIISATSLLIACTAPQTNLAAAAQANVRLGLAYLQNNNAVLAKPTLQKALKESPLSPLTWDAMGYYLESTQKEKQAAYYYRHAVQLNLHSGAAHNNYGIFLCRSKQYEKGIHQLVLATQTPRYANAQNASRNAELCFNKQHNPTNKARRLFSR